jgi:hypothetical protein
MSVVLSVFLAVVVAPFLTWAYYNRRRNSCSLLGQLQGPKSPSFWIGKRRVSTSFFVVVAFVPQGFS